MQIFSSVVDRAGNGCVRRCLTKAQLVRSRKVSKVAFCIRCVTVQATVCCSTKNRFLSRLGALCCSSHYGVFMGGKLVYHKAVIVLYSVNRPAASS